MDRSGTGSRQPSLRVRPRVLRARRIALCAPRIALRALQKALLAPQKALLAPQKALHASRKALLAPQKALHASRKALRAPRLALCSPQKALREWRRGSVGCVAVALISGVLASCGSVPASTTAASSGTAPRASATPSPSAGQAAAAEAVLCRDTASVSGLEIVRNRVSRVPVLQIAFPQQVSVATPARARAVARALCALPVFPPGIVNCPALLIGTTYLLGFAANGRRLPAAAIEATGCEAVSGVGPTRQAASSPGFWRTLASAANLRPPGRSAFTGSGRPGCQPASSRPGMINGCPAVINPGPAVP
jgi:hypothetical protein